MLHIGMAIIANLLVEKPIQVNPLILSDLSGLMTTQGGTGMALCGRMSATLGLESVQDAKTWARSFSPAQLFPPSKAVIKHS
jgi:hypothetical protein